MATHSTVDEAGQESHNTHPVNPNSDQEKLNKELLEAAESGNERKVKALLSPKAKPGADVKAKNADLETPLHVAARTGHVNVVRELLRHPIDLGAQDHEGETALFCAAKTGAGDVVELLLRPKPNRDNQGTGQLVDGNGLKSYAECPANVDITDLDGDTPLHVASRFGMTQVVRHILEFKTRPEAPAESRNIDLKDVDGWTPLYSACVSDHAEVVRLFYETNLELRKKYQEGQHRRTEQRGTLQVNAEDTHHQATKKGIQLEAQEKQKEKYIPMQSWADPGVEVGGKNETALHIAAKYGFARVTKELLRMCADPKAKTTDCETPLHLAASQGQRDVIQEILSNPVGKETLEAKAQKDYTPLHAAVEGTEYDAVRLLLDQAADPLAKTKDGKIALHLAAENRFDGIISTLLKSRADQQLQAKDNSGRTALHVAASIGSDSVFECLLDKNISIMEKDSKGDTALHIAAAAGYAGIFAMEKIVPNFILSRNDAGDTSLHLAAAQGHMKVVKVILGKIKKSDITVLNSQKDTALGKAAKERKWEVCRILLISATEADFGSSNMEEGIIDLAARHHDTHDIVALLLEKRKNNKMKKSLNAQRNNKSLSKDYEALHWAAYYGKWQVAWWLLHTRGWSGIQMRAAEKACKAGKAEVEAAQNNVLPKAGRDMWGDARLADWRTQDKLREKMSWLGMTLRNFHIMLSDSVARDQLSPCQEGQTGEGGCSEEEGYLLTLDMLHDPPMFESPKAEEPLECPRRPDLDQSILERYYVAMVDFFCEDKAGGRAGMLRRSRKVSTVIYEGKGPEDIMNAARGTISLVDTEYAQQIGFAKKDFRFRWIHLPANNMEWMIDMVKLLYCRRSGSDVEHYRAMDAFLREHWHELPEGPFNSRFMKPACSHVPAPVKPSTTSPEIAPMNGVRGDIQTKSDSLFSFVCLYMPYLTFSNYLTKNAEKDQNLQEYEELLNKNSDGTRVIHGSRTLDEAYYDFLSKKDERNEDQVVTKYIRDQAKRDQTREVNPSLRDSQELLAHISSRPPAVESHRKSKPEMKKSSGVSGGAHSKEAIKILRVDQLWLWVIDEQTIITSSTHRTDGAEDPVLEKLFRYLRDQQGKARHGRGKPLPRTVTEMSRLITKFCIDFFDHPTWDDFGVNESIRQIFSNSICQKATEEAALFNGFTGKMKEIIDSLDDQSSSKKHKPEPNDQGKKNFESIKTAAELLREIKDIRDELNILKTILQHQNKVWSELMEESTEKTGSKGSGYLINDVIEMEKSAARIQENVVSILSLEQNEAAISEAASSRERAQETVEQGRTLMLFTIFTIVFLPPSFLTSLFALNITAFPHTRGSLQYEPGFIFSIIFGVTAAIAVPFISGAFARQRLKTIKHNLGDVLAFVTGNKNKTTSGGGSGRAGAGGGNEDEERNEEKARRHRYRPSSARESTRLARLVEILWHRREGENGCGKRDEEST